MGSLERASGECSRLTESLEAQEAQRDRHRSEIESIKLEVLSLEAQKKLAVSSRSFKRQGASRKCIDGVNGSERPCNDPKSDAKKARRTRLVPWFRKPR